MILYLTSTEQELFEKLPASLRASFGVQSEKGTAYENEEELAKRMMAIAATISPTEKVAAQTVVNTIMEHGADAFREEDFPQHLLPWILLAIGAVGLRQIIGQILEQATGLSDLDGLADLTVARNKILLTNHLLREKSHES